MNDHMKNEAVTVDDLLKIHGGKFNNFAVKRFDVDMEHPATAVTVLTKRDGNVTTDVSIKIHVHKLLLYILNDAKNF